MTLFKSCALLLLSRAIVGSGCDVAVELGKDDLNGAGWRVLMSHKDGKQCVAMSLEDLDVFDGNPSDVTSLMQTRVTTKRIVDNRPERRVPLSLEAERVASVNSSDTGNTSTHMDLLQGVKVGSAVQPKTMTTLQAHLPCSKNGPCKDSAANASVPVRVAIEDAQRHDQGQQIAEMATLGIHAPAAPKPNTTFSKELSEIHTDHRGGTLEPTEGPGVVLKAPEIQMTSSDSPAAESQGIAHVLLQASALALAVLMGLAVALYAGSKLRTWQQRDLQGLQPPTHVNPDAVLMEVYEAARTRQRSRQEIVDAIEDSARVLQWVASRGSLSPGRGAATSPRQGPAGIGGSPQPPELSLPVPARL